jgi:hypothetical protein
MRTLNDIACSDILVFAALQTADNSGGIQLAPDDGLLRELIINTNSGTMTVANTFDVTINEGTEITAVFTIPVVAQNVPARAIAEKVVRVNIGDRIEVNSNGDTAGTVPAIGLLIIRR